MSKKKVETKPNKALFPIERLKKDCLQLFGVTTSTFDGATHTLKGEYTVEEIRAKIMKWKNTQVFSK